MLFKKSLNQKMKQGIMERFIYSSTWDISNKLLDLVFENRENLIYLRKTNKIQKKLQEKICNNLYLNKRTSYFKYQEKFNEKISKNRRFRISLYDIMNEKKGKRFHHYSEIFRKRVDYRYNLVPIDYGIIVGIKNKNKVLDEDKTCYCYNKKGRCPFWRKNNSIGIVFCDAYNDTFEVDNGKRVAEKNLFFYKSEKKMKRLNKFSPIALFDKVDCCNLKYN